jgi:hypothetical protein
MGRSASDGVDEQVCRILSKDPVTSPIRAPFTRYEELQAPAELHEEVRGTGVQKTLGELLTCPFCLAPWFAMLLSGGWVLSPTLTRMVTAAGTAVLGSDMLQYGFAWLQQQQAE